MKKILIILFLSINLNIFSQNNWVGVSTLYNFQTESIGFGVHFTKDFNKFSVSPIIFYYPKNNFNKLNEALFGIDFKYNFYKYKKIKSYAFIGFAYNGWISYNESYLPGAQYNNLNTDLGVSIKYNTCISPFLEIRYSIKWMECSIRAGVSFGLKCPKHHKVNIKDLPNYNN